MLQFLLCGWVCLFVCLFWSVAIYSEWKCPSTHRSFKPGHNKTQLTSAQEKITSGIQKILQSIHNDSCRWPFKSYLLPKPRKSGYQFYANKCQIFTTVFSKYLKHKRAMVSVSGLDLSWQALTSGSILTFYQSPERQMLYPNFPWLQKTTSAWQNKFFF